MAVYVPNGPIENVHTKYVIENYLDVTVAKIAEYFFWHWHITINCNAVLFLSLLPFELLQWTRTSKLCGLARFGWVVWVDKIFYQLTKAVIVNRYVLIVKFCLENVDSDIWIHSQHAIKHQTPFLSVIFLDNSVPFPSGR